MTTPAQLTNASHTILAREMCLRAVVAGPLHAALYALMVVTMPLLGGQPWKWLPLAGILTCTAMRFALLRACEAWTGEAARRRLWLAGFGIASLFLAVSWAYPSVRMMDEFGFTAETVMLVIAVFGVAALAVPAFAYDIFTIVSFLQVLLLPYTLMAFSGRGSEAWNTTFGAGTAGFNVFITFVAVHMHRFTIKSRRQVEVISEQKGDLERLHNTVRTMIDSLGEAFLLIDREGRFLPTESARARELFGRDPSGQDLRDVLGLKDEERASVADWLEVCYLGRFDFEDMAGLGPQKFTDPARNLVVALRYRPMRDGNGNLESIVMVAEDISREVEAERQAKDGVLRAEMILNVLKDPEGFKEFLAEAENSFRKMAEGGFAGMAPLRRELHTLKGSAGMFRVAGVAYQIHEAERVLKKAEDLRHAPELGGKLLAQFNDWAEREHDLLAHLDRLARPEPRTLGRYLESFRDAVQNLASELGKQVTFTVTKGPFDPEVGAKVPAVLRTLVHVFNNAVDHGLEPPEERRALGKSEAGTIKVDYLPVIEAGTRFLRLTIQDDGAGIRESSLRQALLRKNPDAALPEAPIELYQRIFDDGVSSREEVTRVSGHGVGMGAVKAAALECGGSVKVVKSDGAGTQIELLIPTAVFELHAKAA